MQQLSQFWYDETTARALAEEAMRASHNKRCAFVRGRGRVRVRDHWYTEYITCFVFVVNVCAYLYGDCTHI